MPELGVPNSVPFHFLWSKLFGCLGCKKGYKSLTVSFTEFQFFCLQPHPSPLPSEITGITPPEMFQALKARFCILASLLQAIWLRVPWSARSAGLAHLPFDFQNWTDIFQLLFYILLLSPPVVSSFLQVYVFFNPISTIWLEI